MKFPELSKKEGSFFIANLFIILYNVKHGGGCLKEKLIKKLNDLYYKTLAKEKHRNALNNFLFFFLWKLAFFVSSLKGTDKKLILFVANNDYEMPKEYKALYDTAKKNGYKCICLYRFKGGSRVIFKNELSKIKSDLVFQKYYARAKTVFLYDYYLPAYANKPKKGTRLVQLWHGCGAFKKWGYSTKDSSWGMNGKLLQKYHVHKNYTDVVTSSSYIIPKYAEAFGISEEIISPVGVPRTDVYFDEEFVNGQHQVLLGKYPELAGKKLILWAPTFRGNSFSTSYNEKAIDFLKFKDALGENTALLIKLHPHVAEKLSFTEEEKAALSGFVFDISQTVLIDTALCACDMVIADYSSLIFEYALLSRPMIFFAYDLEEYTKERSFYYDYESFVPGKIVKNTDELIEAIKAAKMNYDKEKLSVFKEKFMSACDGNSTQRIFEKFIKSG